MRKGIATSHHVFQREEPERPRKRGCGEQIADNEIMLRGLGGEKLRRAVMGVCLCLPSALCNKVLALVLFIFRIAVTPAFF